MLECRYMKIQNPIRKLKEEGTTYEEMAQRLQKCDKFKGGLHVQQIYEIRDKLDKGDYSILASSLMQFVYVFGIDFGYIFRNENK